VERKATDQQIEEFLALFDSPLDGIRSTANYIRSNHMKPVISKPPAPLPDTPVIISLDNVRRTYKIGKQKIDALKNVSLEIHEGEIIAITGKSGSGKSTLLQLIGCLDKPTSGTISIEGRDVRKLSDAKLSRLRRQTVGFVFQSFYLQPFLNVNKNVAVPAMFASDKKKLIETKTSELLEGVDLDQYGKSYPKELSGGQIQRAAIARALVNEPKILLADEPTGNLDSGNGKIVMALFKKIRDERGTTVVIVTHDEELASQADRIIRIEDGSVVL